MNLAVILGAILLLQLEVECGSSVELFTLYKQQATDSTVSINAKLLNTSGNNNWTIYWNINQVLVAQVLHDASSCGSWVTNSSYSHQIIVTRLCTNESFSTTLVIKTVQQKLNITLVSDFIGLTNSSLILSITDCPTNFPNGLIVESLAAEYNATGSFNCSSGKELFYYNSTKPAFNVTTCHTSFKWKNENVFQCWSAPDPVSIKGNLTAMNGSKLSLTCEYNDTLPVGNSSLFYVGKNLFKEVLKGKLFTKSISVDDHNKSISCQAVTPFTKLYNTTGRSKQYSLNVLFNPFQKDITECNWFTEKDEDCAVPFLSNPDAKFVALWKNDQLINRSFGNLESEGNKKQIFHFNKDDVVLDDEGSYKVELRLPGSSDEVFIKFKIILKTDNTKQLLIIAIICVLSSIILFSFGVIIVCKRKKINEMAYQAQFDGYNNSALEQQEEPSYIDANVLRSAIPSSHQTILRTNLFPHYENLGENISITRDESGYIAFTTVPPQQKINSFLQNVAQSSGGMDNNTSENCDNPLKEEPTYLSLNPLKVSVKESRLETKV
ncbi:unnamed protein product [Clavelina lepadiformis]|uniref:Ig-like domain-containing protein n=1 Tax=Clavelina lepadiformis TaxID=159417 RepID=A0ABP0FI50_CLALP